MLRSALSLSLLTQQPFRMVHIRGQRQSPGLKRQHLACVRAALQLGGGAADGAELLSKELVFHPGSAKAGTYHINIGSAGSTSLVAQTLIPVLCNLPSPSSLTIEGGTHVPSAPSYDFLQSQYLPALRQMGQNVSIELVKAGFFPAGGGCLKIDIKPPSIAQPFTSLPIGQLTGTQAVISHHKLDKVAHTLQTLLAQSDETLQVEIKSYKEAVCPGLTVRLESTHTTTQNTSYTLTTDAVALHQLRSQTLVSQLLKKHQRKLSIQTSIDHNLADQLMIYLAQHPNSSLRTGPLTNHLETNASVIEAFLPGALKLEAKEKGQVLLTSHPTG